MTQALSFSRMDEKALVEDEANVLLRRCIAELEEANVWLEESNAAMRLTVSSSGDAVAAVRCELDKEIEHYEG
jgi:hypothetical protein